MQRDLGGVCISSPTAPGDRCVGRGVRVKAHGQEGHLPLMCLQPPLWASGFPGVTFVLWKGNGLNYLRLLILQNVEFWLPSYADLY